MKREIKFRGKEITNGKLIYGNLTIEYDKSFFISFWQSVLVEPENNYREMKCFSYEVDHNSIGQFTGLHDKNGKEIYEGDIVVGGGCLKPIHVQWNNKGRWCFGESNLDFTESTIKQLEIIGNIYENPDLCNT